MKLKKNNSKLKFLTILAIAACSIVATQNYSNAMESTTNSSISVNKNNKNFKLDNEHIKQYAEDSANNFLKKLESLKKQGKDLNKVKIVLIARGGNHDMHDNERCYLDGKKVNHGLDFLCYDIADYLEGLNNQLTDDSSILPIIVDQADLTVTELNSVRNKHDSILPAIPLHRNVECNDAYNVNHFGGNSYNTSTQLNALTTFLENIATKIGYTVVKVYKDENSKPKVKFVKNENENETIPLIYLMIGASNTPWNAFRALAKDAGLKTGF